MIDAYLNPISTLFAQASTQAVTDGPATGEMIALLGAGIVLLLVLILWLKLSAFLALLIVSVLVAATSKLVNPEAVPITQVAQTIVDSMGGALGFIATIIGIGAIFGAILERSGGTESLANFMVKKFGPKHAPWAMLVTGFVISIPVFLDVALVILAPLLFALARDTKRPFLHFGLPLVAGLAVTHGFVPPTPGPVAVAYFLNVNLGWVILFGVLVGFPTALICGPPLCIWLSKFVDVKMPEPIATEQVAKDKLPPISFILALIALPIGLILINTTIEQWVASGVPGKEALTEWLAQTHPGAKFNSAQSLWVKDALTQQPFVIQFLTFLGHPVIALLTSTVFALYFLGTRRGVDREALLEISTKALGPAGIIILITGAGGVFKGVLKATGITEALEVMFSQYDINVLVLAWIFATLIRIAQGSATVAMLTAAGLMVNFVEGMSQPQLALVSVAIAAGATGFSHVNDSGFWMISRYFNMSEGQTLKTWGVISTCISLVGFTLAMLLWQLVG